MVDFSVFQFSKSIFSGSGLSKMRGDGFDFDSLRPYSPGDDSKNIDWRASLRSGKTSVRTYLSEKEIPVWIVFDDSPTIAYGTDSLKRVDAMVKAAFFLAERAVAVGHPVAFTTYSGRFRDFSPSRDLANFKTALSRFRDFVSTGSNDEYFDLSIPKLRNLMPVRSAVFFFSDAFETPAPALRKHLRDSYLHYVRVVHPLDVGPANDDWRPGVFWAWISGLSAGESDQKLLPPEKRLFSAGFPSCAIMAGEDPYRPLADMFLRTYG